MYKFIAVSETKWIIIKQFAPERQLHVITLRGRHSRGSVAGSVPL